MNKRILLLAALFCHQAYAQVAPYAFHLGKVRVTADATAMSIDTPVPIKVDILPGGHTWPLLTLDEEGTLYVGDRIVSSRQPERQLMPAGGRTDERSLALPHGYRITALDKGYRVSRGRLACMFAPRQLGLDAGKSPFEALKDGNLVFRASERQLLVLSTWLGAEKEDTRYSVVDIDLPHCRTHATPLGNPDLLVELNGSSGGGWWITGSIEQTLLQSKDGRNWRRVALPSQLSSLISAYMVSPDDIWLAGILPGALDDERNPLIIHSSDGGKHWKNITRIDPVLARMPPGWLEGWQRLGEPIAR